MIDRRRMLLTGGCAALVSRTGHAQRPDRIHRVAVISPSTSSATDIREVVLPELAKLGFVEGRNLTVSMHIGSLSNLPALGREALGTRPDVVIAATNAGVRAILDVSKTVPIVMAFAGEDPVATGLAQSLARPGGSVTGLTNMTTQLDGKRMALLHEAVPAAKRIGILAVPPPRHVDSIREIKRVGALLGVQSVPFYAHEPDMYPEAFAQMRAAGTQALVYAGAPEFVRDVDILGSHCLEAGMASIGEAATMARKGSLIGYGPDRVVFRKRAAHFVARILGGTPPGEIPIEQPTHYVFAINLLTAKALGLSLPQSILVQATEVIE